MQPFHIPPHFESWIEQQIRPLGHSLTNPKSLGKAILKVSDQYISKGKKNSSWGNKDFRAAYLSYFFPLNYLRNCRVFHEAKALNFFENLRHHADFGCGPGTTLAALNTYQIPLISSIGIDQHSEAKKLFFSLNNNVSFSCQWDNQPPPLPPKSFLTLSYVLNELQGTPTWLEQWLDQATGLLIIEPATRVETQQLQKTRTRLMDKGYQPWAPCLHSAKCPLIGHKKDWCQTRLNWTPPPWFQRIEDELPIKNQHLSFSFLLMKKNQPPNHNGIRIVGNAQKEKGKTRWQYCSPGERKFISCLHRNGEPPRIHAGDIVSLPDQQTPGSEWRFLPNSSKTLNSSMDSAN